MKNKKIRLNLLLFYIHLIKYNIKYRSMGLDLGFKKKTEPDMFGQQDSGGPELDSIISHININTSDSILDIGSGKGGALISLAKYPFKNIVGVELYENVCEISRKNILKTQHRNIVVYCADARFFVGYDDYNIFYVYNPFSGVIMESVLRQISKSLKHKPRDIVFIYFNPLYHDVVDKSGVFVKYIDPNIFSLNVRIYTNNKNFKLK